MLSNYLGCSVAAWTRGLILWAVGVDGERPSSASVFLLFKKECYTDSKWNGKLLSLFEVNLNF